MIRKKKVNVKIDMTWVLINQGHKIVYNSCYAIGYCVSVCVCDMSIFMGILNYIQIFSISYNKFINYIEKWARKKK